MRQNYNPLRILNEKEKQKIFMQLHEQFGIDKIPGILIKRGKERIFLFQGSLSKNQIFDLENNVPIERVGVYFAKEHPDGIRLSIEGIHTLGAQIKKNIFDLNDEQAQTWLEGSELNIAAGKKGFLVMKHHDDFIGCGKASLEKISNFVPKSRRLKIKN